MNVVAAVIRRGDRFLLCQRPLRKQHGGLWEFPGGKIRERESPFCALKRELEEELGVRSEPLRREVPINIKIIGESALSIRFIETEIQDEPIMLEHQNMGWFSSEELLKLDLAPADAKFAAKYFKVAQRVRYWWVNQNQTFRQEIEGGYLWSPKRNANGARNPFYEHMREVSPGDLVLSFQGTLIRAVGIACSFAYESPKPTEFQNAGTNWSSIGWRVDVSFSLLRHQIKPADHMGRLRVELPRKYSPLRPNGHGLQSVYLTAIPQGLMHALADLVGQELTQLVYGYVEDLKPLTQIRDDGLAKWEEQLRERLEQDTAIDQTEKEQVILARRGQGRFKRNVGVFESKCRITEVDRLEHLRASHIRPWRDCESNESRLDGENGLLLTPTVDHLFDRGFISFEDTGRLLVSPVVHLESLQKMGVPEEGHKCGGFTEGQRKYLEFHRETVFLCSSLN